MKAAHYLGGARSVIGHSVRALIEALDPRCPALDDALSAARALDLLYIPIRYPNGLAAGTPAQAFDADQSERALEHASTIVDAVAGLAPPPPFAVSS